MTPQYIQKLREIAGTLKDNAQHLSKSTSLEDMVLFAEIMHLAGFIDALDE